MSAITDFAIHRAQATGEDAEYIAGIIYIAIARRSLLILDSAGIPTLADFSTMNIFDAENAVLNYCKEANEQARQ